MISTMPSDQVDALLRDRADSDAELELMIHGSSALSLPTPAQIESDVAFLDAAFSKDKA